MDPKDRKSYSDLEAIVTSSSSSAAEATRHQSYWNEKFLAAPTSPDPRQQQNARDAKDGKADTDSLKEAAGPGGVSPVDTLPPPPPAYYLVDSQGQTQALYTVPASNNNNNSSNSSSSSASSASSDAGSILNFKAGGGVLPPRPPPAPQGWWSSLGEGRRLFGMRKNVFLAVMAGMCALILGLLTTILLVTRSGSGAGSGSGPGSGGRGGHPAVPAFSVKELLQKGDAGPLLAASSLAAANWTDTATGLAYSGVFYQSSAATGSALMVAFKNEQAQAWSSINISASASKTKLDVLPGTPLAAATNNGLWNLYYLSTAMTVEEVYATDPTSGTGWQQGSFGSVLNRPAVVPGSGLAAMWQSCSDCDNALFVTWQSADSLALVYANMTNLTWGEPVVVATSGAPGTSVVTSAFTDTGNKVKSGADHNAIRWYYQSPRGLEEVIKGPVGSGRLLAGNFDKPVAIDLPDSPLPRLASMTYGSDLTGWTSNFLTYVDPTDGSLTSMGWTPGTPWKKQPPALSGSPGGLVKAGFSAVALTQAMTMYVLSPSQGEIHEYATNSTNPWAWTWQDKVDLSN